MISQPSLLRRLYDSVALFALLNLLVFGGLGAYAIFAGGISPEKVQAIAAVMRGAKVAGPDVPQPPGEPSAPSEMETEAAAVPADAEKIEIMQREAERIKEELRQRLALNNSILLRVQAEREAFEKEQAEAAKREAEAAQERDTEGFRKQIEILEGLKPKAAVLHLLGQGDPDEAARLLVEMDTRKAQKIVQAATEPGQLQRMMIILQRMREVSPEKSAQISGGESGP